MLKILFQGDSLTDCGRDKTKKDFLANYGFGYANLIASKLMCEYPGTVIENRAVAGNRIGDMYARWIEDALNIDCNILSILCGVNDIGFGIRMNQGADAKKFGFIYELMINEMLERKPDIRLVLCEPFLFKIEENTPESGRDIVENWDLWNGQLTERRAIIAELAKKYNAVFVPFAKSFEEAFKLAPPQHWSVDCIHATNAGHALMAKVWLETVKPEQYI
ncbi:MAG: SGNH/GDSL hydrolase family protein [Clostridiales bacterium]|nr:SGNH/GDSL hydrolase family protein [Clostridiales bacterium]